VVDSNIIAARSLASSMTPMAERLKQKNPVWVVPILWRYAFQNILVTAIKARQTTLERAGVVWERVAGTLANNDSDPFPLKVLDLVARFRITAGDGQFIILAMEMDIPCITEDRALWERFPGIAVSMHDFMNPPTTRAIREKSGRYRGRKIRFKD
jgi:predicted nucleic acid-binding protein